MEAEKMLRIVLGAVATAAVALGQSTGDDPTKSDPIAYLNRALDEIQARSLRREQIDWPRLRKEALARAAGAEITVDTYDAIRSALTSLNDHHSSFHPTPALEHRKLCGVARAQICFGTTPAYWINMQARYDLETARDAFESRIQCEIRPRSAV